MNNTRLAYKEDVPGRRSERTRQKWLKRFFFYLFQLAAEASRELPASRWAVGTKRRLRGAAQCRKARLDGLNNGCVARGRGQLCSHGYALVDALIGGEGASLVPHGRSLPKRFGRRRLGAARARRDEHRSGSVEQLLACVQSSPGERSA
jgi:hypothetical protein